MDDDAYDGDAIVLRSSRGWSKDADGWWSRPLRRRDLGMALRGEREHNRFVVMSPLLVYKEMRGPGVMLGSGLHSFTQNGRLYCRNARQKRSLDNGLPV